MALSMDRIYGRKGGGYTVFFPPRRQYRDACQEADVESWAFIAYTMYLLRNFAWKSLRIV